MKKEIDIAFALLCSALEGLDVSTSCGLDVSLSTKDWWGLFRLMQQNHVSALASEAFAHLEQKPPREVLIPWLSEQQKAIDYHHHQARIEQELKALFASKHIDCMVLKGTHLASYYPRPELREFGDLDLYFYHQHREADALAVKRLHVDIHHDGHHHTKYAYNGVTVESHYDFLNIHYPPSNRRYEALLKELVNAENPLPTTHYPLPTFEVLFLLRHMACHFASNRISLRDLCDWYCLNRAIGQHVDMDLVRDTVRRFGMVPFASVLDEVMRRRFGLDLHYGEVADKALVERFERDTVYGNSQRDAHDHEDLGRLWWKLRRFGSNRWKQRMVFNDNIVSLYVSSLTSHAAKPRSILHKV